MPGKHAPASPRSFYFSVARAAGSVLAVVALIVLVVLAATGSGDGKKPSKNTAAETVIPSTSTGTEVAGVPSASSTAPVASASPAPSAQTTVVVLNGTARAGLAKALASKLRLDGYRVLATGNAVNVATTTIYYRPGFSGEAEALRAAELVFVDPAQVKPAPAKVQADSKARITIVIGTDYP